MEVFRPNRVLSVQDESGYMYANVMHPDVSVQRLALIRAVEEWFDRVMIPNWERAQLDSFPALTARLR